MTLPATAPRDEVALAARHFSEAAARLPTLFDLENNAYWLLSLLEEADDPEAADIQNQLALVDQMLAEKTESYVSIIRSLESMAEARKAEADRLRDRSKSAERQVEWLKQRLLVHMQTTGQRRIETARFTVSLRTNPPSVVVMDAAAIPSEFQRTKIEIQPDKVAILAAFKKDGEIVPGTSIERTTRLAIQ